MNFALLLLQAAVIAVSISVDALAVAFSYGTNKIKIPLPSMLVIAGICTITVAAAFFLGNLFVGFLPDTFLSWVSFIILFSIGVVKLFDSITKSVIRKYLNREIIFSVFSFKMVLHVYADPEAADADTSKCISLKESIVLATSLSLDGFAVGLSAALIGVNGAALIIITFLTGFVALHFGERLGKVAVEKSRFNISWLGGAILICLSVVQLL